MVEAILRRCSVKLMFLNFKQKSYEKTCAESHFGKVAGYISTVTKKNFAKELQTHGHISYVKSLQ